MKKHVVVSSLLLMSFWGHAYASGVASSAEHMPAPAAIADKPNWAVQVTPYLWAASIKGTVSPFKRAPSMAIEKPFKDIIDNLNFGGFLDIWVRHNRYVLSSDIMYVSTTDSHNIGALPMIGPTRGLSADVDTRQFSASLKAGYRVYDTPDLTVDLLAGARLWRISNDVTVRYADYSVKHGERFGWVDPLIGLRIFYNINPKLSLQAQADVGGAGIGAEKTWQALATANYAFTKHFSASIGYKALGVDYRSGGHVFDTRLRGPVAGLTYRF